MITIELSTEEKNEVLEAYTLYCGFNPESLNLLLKSCKSYDIPFNELYSDATRELKKIDFLSLAKFLDKVAVAKLVKEFSKYVNIPFDQLPDPLIAFSTGKAFCTAYVLQQMKELFKYKTDLMNIINNLIEAID